MRFARWLDQQLAATGWAVLGVTAAVPFTYTIGMAAMVGTPDLIATGRQEEAAARILNDSGDQIRAGRRFELAEPAGDLLAGGCRVRFDPLHPNWYEDDVMQASTVLGHAVLPLWQLVWPAQQGHVPDNPRCDAGIRAAQALLCQPRAGADKGGEPAC